MKIPKSFKLIATTYNVEFDNVRMDDMCTYGICDYGLSKIILTDVGGINKLSEDKILDTFYHERTHAILEMMNEIELNKNEQFVDVFSKLLRQAIESESY